MDCRPTPVSNKSLVFPSPSGDLTIIQTAYDQSFPDSEGHLDFYKQWKILTVRYPAICDGGGWFDENEVRFYQVESSVSLTIQWINDTSFLCYQIHGFEDDPSITQIDDLRIFKWDGSMFKSFALQVSPRFDFGGNVVYYHKNKSIFVMGKQHGDGSFTHSLLFEDPWAILDEVRKYMPILPELVNEVIKMLNPPVEQNGK